MDLSSFSGLPVGTQSLGETLQIRHNLESQQKGFP